MSVSFDDIDPDWAWSAWQPTDAEPWNVPRAAHLYRRAGFGASAATLKAAVADGFSQTIDALLATNPPTTNSLAKNSLAKNSDPSEFQATSDQLAASALASGDPRALSSWWLHAMLNSPNPLLEKMTLFWHGHFATGAEKVKVAALMFEQNRSLRQHALGSFRELAHAIARDPAMLIYLDSAVNRKAHANENFARELMELFCLGEGNYSERDVQELARCFTGWEVRRDQFRFNSYQHDTTSKTVLGTKVETGEQAIDVVLASPHAARFIVGKLFRFFVSDEPPPPEKLLAPLVQQMVDSSLNIGSVVRRMLSSQLMFSSHVRGRKVRSPVEWVLNWMKSLQLTTNMKKVTEGVGQLGQNVFYPPNVKGWDGGRAWINSSTLVGRTNLISQILKDPATRCDGQAGIDEFFRRARVRGAQQMLDWCQEHLLAVQLSKATQERALMSMRSVQDKPHSSLILLAALPEMQLT